MVVHQGHWQLYPDPNISTLQDESGDVLLDEAGDVLLPE